MKRKMKKLLVMLLTSIMVLSSFTLTAAAKEEEYDLYIGFGGDAAASGDWGYQYNSPNADNNVGDVVATNGKIKVGDTVTVSLQLPAECLHTYWIAPVVVAEGVSNLDATVTCKIDGTDVTDTIDFGARADGKFWYEGTGEYTETQSIRLAGGYNEWGDKFFAESPVFTTIEYTVTLNSLEKGEAAGEVVESDFTGEADVFVGFGGDAAESGDWGYQYNSPNADNNVGDVVATNGTIKVGDTVTVSLQLPAACVHTYWLAPVIVAEGITSIDATVSCKIDGVDVTDTIDFGARADGSFWYEGTGEYTETQSIRLAGGYNEWGDKFFAESPIFTTVEYTITLNSMKTGTAAPAEPEGTSLTVDKSGVYHAYIGFQSPTYTFRNKFNDKDYGRDTDFFNQVTGWDESNTAIAKEGTLTDVEIKGNGTYTVSVDGLVLDGEFDKQEYMNLIFLSTDVPNTGDITFSDVVLKVNGKSTDLSAAGAIVSPDDVDYTCILLQNIWNEDIKEIGYYAVPPTSISITFTVSGFDYDNAAEAPADDTATPAEDTTAPVEESSSNNTVIIIVVVVAVVVVIAVVVAIVASKKKGNKAE